MKNEEIFIREEDSPGLKFHISGNLTEELFRVTREGENDYRIKFDKNLVELVFENETEASLEILVKKK
jgi:hypothetical protein